MSGASADLVGTQSALTQNIKTFNANNSYMGFSASLNSSTTANASSSIFSRTDLGVVMGQASETNGANPIALTLLDNNLHDIETATYNVAVYYAGLKWAALQSIRNGTNPLTKYAGLVYVARPGFFDNCSNFFLATAVVEPRNPAIVDGFVGHGSAIAMQEGFASATVAAQPSSVQQPLSPAQQAAAAQKAADAAAAQKAEDDRLAAIAVAKKAEDDRLAAIKKAEDDRLAAIAAAKKAEEDRIAAADRSVNNIPSNKTGFQYALVTGTLASAASAPAFFSAATALPNTIPGFATSLGSIADATGGQIAVSSATTPAFSARWTGYFRPDFTGVLTFWLSSNGYAYVNMNNGVAILETSGNSLQAPVSKGFAVASGKYYPIEIGAGFAANAASAFSVKFSSGTSGSAASSTSNFSKHVSALVPTTDRFSTSVIPSSSDVTSFSKTLANMFAIAMAPVAQNQLVTNYPALAYDRSRSVAGISAAAMQPFFGTTGISPSSAFSIEWFGYFTSPSTSNYRFTLRGASAAHSSAMWLGETALVAYTPANAIVNNLGQGFATSTVLQKSSVGIPIPAGVRVPVRIQYSQQASTAPFNFNIGIESSGSNGAFAPVSTDGAQFFAFYTDSSSQLYEPMQMAFALRDDTGASPPSSLQSCYVSPVNSRNNAANNAALRALKVNRNAGFSSIVLFQASALALSPSGVLSIRGGGTGGGDYTLATVGSASCGAGCSSVPNTYSISGITILLGTWNVNQYFTMQSRKMQAPDGSTYDQIDFAMDVALFKQYNGGVIPTGALTVKYTLGSGASATQKTMQAASMQTPFSISNLAESTATVAAAIKCAQSITSACTFSLSLTPTGNMAIYNNGTQVWESSKLIGAALPNAAHCIAVDAWASEMSRASSNSLTSQTFAAPFDSRPATTGLLGAGGVGAIYSANAKFKLTVEGGALVLKYSLAPTRLIVSSGGNNAYFFTQRTASTPFYMYLADADEKMFRYFSVNKAAGTMTDLKVGPTSSVSLGTGFKPSATDQKYQNPPSGLALAPGASGRAYQSFANTSQSDCAAKCVASSSCGHYYSYTAGGAPACAISADGGAPLAFPATPGVTNSRMYERVTGINTSCAYSFPPYTAAPPGAAPVVSSNSDYSTYKSAAMNAATTSVPTSVPASREGACGDPNIASRTEQMVGPVNGSYAYNSFKYSEKFTTLKEAGGALTTSGQASALVPSKTREGFSADDTLPDASGNVPGYRASNACTSIAMGTAGAGLLANCKADLLGNAAAIQRYSSTYNTANARIDANYRAIEKDVRDVSASYPIVNDPTTTDMFRQLPSGDTGKAEAIDACGNLLFVQRENKSPKLADAMLYDATLDLTQESTLFAVGSVAVSALLIGALMVMRR